MGFFSQLETALTSGAMEGNWSDLILKEGMPPKYADASGHVVPIPGDLPYPEARDFEEILERQTRKENRFTMEHRSGPTGEPMELDFATEVAGIRFRTNLFNYNGGRTASVMRKLNAHIPDFETLGLPIDKTLKFFEQSSGIVLFCGATGSGKSTSMASGLLRQCARHIHILAIEDPIEYIIPANLAAEVTQREIGPDSKSFSYALRAALREKPDIIMVGELRDAETIETASIAANSGHLVFSTTHARSASEAIRRILESMPESSRDAMRTQLSSSLIGVIAQTLVPRADGKGKVLAYEIMAATPAIRANIASGKFAAIYSDIDTGSTDGMITMEKCLQNLFKSGMITKESAYAKAANPDKMRALIG